MIKKIHLIIPIIFLTYASAGQVLNPEMVNMYPDDLPAQFQKGDATENPVWKTNTTTFHHYNGELLMITHVKNMPQYIQVYVLNSDSDSNYVFEPVQINFNESEDNKLSADHNDYRPVTFEYNNRLWYNVTSVTYAEDFQAAIVSRFYELPVALTDGVEAYSYDKRTYPVDMMFWQDRDLDVLKAACQVGEYVYFYKYNSYINKRKWYTEKCKYENNQFKHVESWTWADGADCDSIRDIGGVLNYKKKMEGTRDINVINLFNGQKKKSYLVMEYLEGGKIHHKHLLTIYNTKVSTIIKGTVKGKRDKVSGPKDCTDRFTLFYISSNKVQGAYPVKYMEFCVVDHSPYVVWLANGTINVPGTIKPHNLHHDAYGSGYYLYSAYTYEPKAFTDLNFDPATQKKQPDGLQQKVSLFYPYNYGGEYAGLFFDSDVWRPFPKDSVRSSVDLHDTTKYGEKIRSMWTLTGLLDGAPPCSIDWEVWDSANQNMEYATNLKFSTENKTETTLAVTAKDQYTLGSDLTLGDEDAGAYLKESFKYSHAFQHKTEKERINETTISQEFVLNEETQGQGYYLWTIPEVLRATYQVYPWWGAEKMEYPLDSSLHYMFRTTGVRLFHEPIDIRSYPFYIDSANAQSMDSWKLMNRQGIYDAHTSPQVLVGNINLSDDGNPGSSLEFYQEDTKTETTTSSSSFEFEVEAGMKVPEIFSGDASFGYSIDYENEYSISTSFGTGLEASLEQLHHNLPGLNLESLSLNVYYFWNRSDEEGWWFYDSIPDGQHPWYIAYAIPESSANLLLLSPKNAADGYLKYSELLFSWTSEIEKLSEYTIFISKDPRFSNNNMVYRKEVGDVTWHNPVNFNPEAQQTYHWCVSGVAETGETIWSEVSSFVMEDPIQTNPGLGDDRVIVYPNPVKEGSLNISFDSPAESDLSVSVYDYAGKLVYLNSVTHHSGVISELVVPTADLVPGVYIVVIRSGSSVYTRKACVL